MILWRTRTRNLGALGQLIVQCKNPRAALKQVGQRGVNELKKWFRSRDRVPNRLGGRRSHLWRQIADSVSLSTQLGSTAIFISVGHPVLRQKVKGGLIKAKRGKYLTIPKVKEAYGRTAAVYERETGNELIFVKRRRTAMLIEDLANGAYRVVYILVRRVNQQPDPNALPPTAAWNEALLDQARKSLARQNQTPTP